MYATISFDYAFTNIFYPRLQTACPSESTNLNFVFPHRVNMDAVKPAIIAVQKRQNNYANRKKDNVAYVVPFPHPAEDGGSSFGF
jgi:hypothetical protein